MTVDLHCRCSRSSRVSHWWTEAGEMVCLESVT